jgi:hypothetical protein
LTDAVIEALEGAACRTLVLVATNEGRSIYERRGFTLDTTYRTLEASGTARVDGSLRPFVPEDLGSMIALDRLATGEDRDHLLRTFATPTSARILDGDDGNLRGFVVRAPWGGGATVAASPTDAVRILEGRRASSHPDRRVRAGLLAENEEGIDRLRRLGWVEAWHAPRFVRGAVLEWRPTWLWGQFNLAIG